MIKLVCHQVGQTYGKAYAIPSEDEYYQQNPPRGSPAPGEQMPDEEVDRPADGEDEDDERGTLSEFSARRSKPMPKESSFFIFSSKNR